MRTPPVTELVAYLRRQRFSGGLLRGDVAVNVREVLSAPVDSDLEVAWWVVRSGDARLLVAMAHCTGPAPVADVIRVGENTWFDALAHPPSAAHALQLLGTSAARGIRAVWLDDVPLTLTAVRTSPVDQSNTTVRTDVHVLKVLRRLHPGRNPEVELGLALREAGSAHVAALCGWATLEDGDGECDVLTVHRRVDGPDGFTIARADADLAADGRPEQHFPGAAYELGIALGAVHNDLAAAFGQHRSAGFAAELSRRLLRRLDALRDLDVLAPYLENAEAIFTGVASCSAALPTQRIHGDLHLGQTLFGDDGWRLIDFEGEPRRPLVERSAADTPMRDLAGMLRSFDYAARWNGARDAGGWATRTGEMFLEGYHLQCPDAVQRDVLDALVLDKALYEVGYEAAYRPERLRIPLAALAALCGGG